MNAIEDLLEVEARTAYPEECCGFVVTDGENVELIRCANIHPDRKKSFAISAQDTHKAYTCGKKVIGVYHSHPDDTCEPSDADIRFSEESRLAYYIFSYPEKKMCVYQPLGASAQLLGRRFVYGVFDCFTLVRDFYAQRHGINLGKATYESKWWWMREENEHLYLQRMLGFGFQLVTDLKPNDVIAIQLESPIPNHLLVYLGDRQFMHHLTNRKSELATYGGMWEKNTRYFLRHKNLI